MNFFTSGVRSCDMAEPLLKLDFSEDICNTSLQLSMSNDEISKYLEVAPLQVSHQLPREIPGLENFY